MQLKIAKLNILLTEGPGNSESLPDDELLANLLIRRFFTTFLLITADGPAELDE